MFISRCPSMMRAALCLCLIGLMDAWQWPRIPARRLVAAAFSVGGCLLGGPLLSPSALAVDYYDANVAAKYDKLDGGPAADALGLNRLRDEAGSKARGSVLEVAVGTGLQARHYDLAAVTAYTGIDLSPSMLAQARAKWAAEPALAAKRPELVVMDAASLAYPTASFDSVVDTFSMCVFPDPGAALAEMTRVLKPGGRLVLLENSISTNPLLRLVQSVTEPLVTPLAKGCKWDVDVPALVARQEAAGLLRVEERTDEQMGSVVLLVSRRLGQ